ncbi:DNA polymerase III subunit gamma/tau, partial [Candidatus Parcubacteria bacterium]|nr:DNA polymerase III subunit gamma/tau [Candidatus Parcubacteria bacterium]
MSKVLALRYRPRRFADIVGNAFTTRILQNSIITNNLKSAYFLAGGKGSGKTSTARIFAKALNCTGRQEQSPEPCQSCLSCLEVDREVLMGDVMEIDAASNNSVASIRSLITQVQYPPISGKHKVVILDECHMLSAAAAAALLKTLEEPPPHVVFIFCTTDPQRVLDTIRSRALYFEFTRLSTSDISSRLVFIAQQEKLN